MNIMMRRSGMNKLEKQYAIKRVNLDEEHYFQSIMEQAYKISLLTNEELEAVQMQTMQLLSKQIVSFTSGDSSSVRMETAQSIMLSIFYGIGIFLKSAPDVDESIKLIKQKPICELYKSGRLLIDSQMKNARELFAAVKQSRIDTEHKAYNDTLDTGIEPFFSSYNADFAAHDVSGASIDYPLSNDKMNLVGVEYMLSYLQKLLYENQFCQKFSSERIHSLLWGYDKNYEDLLINIYEQVLMNALGCILNNKSALLLDVDPQDRQYLQQSLMRLAKDEIEILFINTAPKLFEQLDITDKELQQYIFLTIQNVSARIKNALEICQLETIFVSLKDSTSELPLNFNDGTKMEDSLFRKITVEIRECRFVSDKIAIIKNNTKSMIDFVDILEGECIFEGEYDKIYGSLGDAELSILLKRAMPTTEDMNFRVLENEKVWERELFVYLEHIEVERKNRIIKLARATNLV